MIACIRKPLLNTPSMKEVYCLFLNKLLSSDAAQFLKNTKRGKTSFKSFNQDLCINSVCGMLFFADCCIGQQL